MTVHPKHEKCDHSCDNKQCGHACGHGLAGHYMTAAAWAAYFAERERLLAAKNTEELRSKPE